MSRVIYYVVEHDGGWAYKSGDIFSETFLSHDDAVKAAKRVAAEQMQAGDTLDIEYEKKDSSWKVEHSDGHNRPKTSVIE